MLELRDIHKSFSGQEVLRGVSFTVARGTTRVILGLSGSGKSVLMKHMIGLMRPSSGAILVDGTDITRISGRALLAVRRKFGMVFQQAALFDSMTVAENIAFPLTEHTGLTRQQIADKVREKLALVRLDDAYHKYPAALSGGMRKRVGLARAVVLGPQCVLYDEPTTGLDPLTTDSVDHMIMDAKEQLGVTSVVISHDIGSALRIADTIAVIHEGRIVEDCAKDELRASTHPFVQQFLHTWFGKQ